MSILQSLLLSNPKVATRFMTGMPASYWVNAGEKHALDVFHMSATSVPSYRDFLAAHDLDHTRVRDIRQFRELVPVSDRQSHFAGNSLDRLLVGNVTDAHMFFMSGGTTGDSLVGATDRATMRTFPHAFTAVFDSQWGICDPSKKVLMVNALSLGAWIGGTYASYIFATISQRYPNIAYTGPGADIDRILDLVETVGMHFDMIILMSYPTFIMEVLRAGQRRGIDWRAKVVKVIVAGERMDLQLRRDILGIISSPIDNYAVMNQYGASEMGNPGVETPLATTIIRLASENIDLCRDIFGGDIPLTLLQNNPVGTFIEVVDDRVIGTSGGLMPVVRYSPKDSGRFFGFDEMNSVLRDHGVDIVESLALDGWDKPVFRWPFLMLGQRADDAVSIYGAKVSPISIQDVFAGDERVRGFVLETDGAGEYTRLTLHIELSQGTSLAEEERHVLGDHYAKTVVERLLVVNFDYQDAWSIHADAMTPNVTVHDYARGPFESQKGAFKPKNQG